MSENSCMTIINPTKMMQMKYPFEFQFRDSHVFRAHDDFKVFSETEKCRRRTVQHSKKDFKDDNFNCDQKNTSASRKRKLEDDPDDLPHDPRDKNEIFHYRFLQGGIRNFIKHRLQKSKISCCNIFLNVQRHFPSQTYLQRFKNVQFDQPPLTISINNLLVPAEAAELHKLAKDTLNWKAAVDFSIGDLDALSNSNLLSDEIKKSFSTAETSDYDDKFIAFRNNLTFKCLEERVADLMLNALFETDSKKQYTKDNVQIHIKLKRYLVEKGGTQVALMPHTDTSILTCIAYLNTVPIGRGGETVFLYMGPGKSKDEPLLFSPIAGHGVLFKSENYIKCSSPHSHPQSESELETETEPKRYSIESSIHGSYPLFEDKYIIQFMLYPEGSTKDKLPLFRILNMNLSYISQLEDTPTFSESGLKRIKKILETQDQEKEKEKEKKLKEKKEEEKKTQTKDQNQIDSHKSQIYIENLRKFEQLNKFIQIENDKKSLISWSNFLRNFIHKNHKTHKNAIIYVKNRTVNLDSEKDAILGSSSDKNENENENDNDNDNQNKKKNHLSDSNNSTEACQFDHYSVSIFSPVKLFLKLSFYDKFNMSDFKNNQIPNFPPIVYFDQFLKPDESSDLLNLLKNHSEWESSNSDYPDCQVPLNFTKIVGSKYEKWNSIAKRAVRILFPNREDAMVHYHFIRYKANGSNKDGDDKDKNSSKSTIKKEPYSWTQPVSALIINLNSVSQRIDNQKMFPFVEEVVPTQIGGATYYQNKCTIEYKNRIIENFQHPLTFHSYFPQEFNPNQQTSKHPVDDFAKYFLTFETQEEYYQTNRVFLNTLLKETESSHSSEKVDTTTATSTAIKAPPTPTATPTSAT